jgi:hypothetical protein
MGILVRTREGRNGAETRRVTDASPVPACLPPLRLSPGSGVSPQKRTGHKLDGCPRDKDRYTFSLRTHSRRGPIGGGTVSQFPARRIGNRSDRRRRSFRIINSDTHTHTHTQTHTQSHKDVRIKLLKKNDSNQKTRRYRKEKPTLAAVGNQSTSTGQG